MNASETDLELLEEYLDGALDSGALALLRQRLASDAPLSASLTELRSQRALRQAAYQSMEPTDVTTQQLMWRVRGAMLDQQRSTVVETQRKTWSQWRIASIGSAAAACMVLGFLFGRLGNGGAVTPLAPPLGVGGSARIENTQLPGTTVAENGGSSFHPVGMAPRISVPITDEYGHVVAFQTFDNPEQAKNFTEDLHHARSGTAQPVKSPQPTLVDFPAQPAPQVPF